MAVVVSVLSGAESAYWGSFTASVIKPACGASSRTTEKFPAIIVTRALIRPIDPATFKASTRVLVRPTGLDMVEVGGSNPPGPTKIKNPPLGGFFGFGGVGLDESHCSTNATKGAFGPPQQSEGARRVQSPEAMAIEDNPLGPTRFLSLCFCSTLFFQNRAFWRISAGGHYR